MPRVYHLDYAKQEIFSVLQHIYTSGPQSVLTKAGGIVRGLIGAYPEFLDLHRLGAQYISIDADNILQNWIKINGKFKTPSRLHSFITASKNGILHEHMTPKSAIKSVLDKFTPRDWYNGTAKKILEACSACALITRKQDSLLAKSSHPNIVNGELNGECDTKGRYDLAKITLKEFNYQIYL